MKIILVKFVIRFSHKWTMHGILSYYGNFPKIFQQVCGDYTINLLLNVRFVRIFFRKDLISCGPCAKTAVEIFGRMDVKTG